MLDYTSILKYLPITTATTADYILINSAGNNKKILLSDFISSLGLGGGGGGSGTVTSVGISAPSAFTITGSPVTTSGTIAITGAGTTLQLIDGTGALQTIPTSLPPSGTAGGDLTGTYPNPTVHRVHGIDMQSGTPSTDDIWIYGGSPVKWQHQKLHSNQVTNDSTVSGTDVDDALNTLDTGKVNTTRTISTTSPLSGGGDLSANRTLSIADAVADGTTKGAAAFTASDFNSSSGVISIDYTNGQAASASAKGFLTASDWSAFSAKQDAITLTTTGSSGPATFISNVLNVPQYTGVSINIIYSHIATF